MEIYSDPASGRYYVVDPVTGESRWIDEPPRELPAAPAAVDGRRDPAPGPGVDDRVPQVADPAREVRGPARDLGTFGAAAVPQQGPGRRSRERSPARAGRARALTITAVGVGVVGVLVVVGSVLRGSGDTAARLADPAPASTVVRSAAPGATPAASSPVARPAVAKIGTPVRDGDLQFTVTGITLSATLGNKFLSTQAEGRFLLVSVTVRNLGREPRLFLAPSQQLFDAHGQQYSADSASAKYLADGDEGVVEQLAPGAVAKCTVVFDVPVDTVLDRIELHESDTSDGVDVKLVR